MAEGKLTERGAAEQRLLVERAAGLAKFAKEVQDEMRARRALLGATKALLIAHTRRDSGSCICGWSRIGASHAGHQVQVLDEAGLLAAAAPDAGGSTNDHD